MLITLLFLVSQINNTELYTYLSQFSHPKIKPVLAYKIFESCDQCACCHWLLDLTLPVLIYDYPLRVCVCGGGGGGGGGGGILKEDSPSYQVCTFTIDVSGKLFLGGRSPTPEEDINKPHMVACECTKGNSSLGHSQSPESGGYEY